MRRRLPLDFSVVFTAAGVVTGIALRVWILASPLGIPDADEDIKGLMVRHLLHGQFRVFFWLQPYGGSQEVVLTAPAFVVFGSGMLQLRIVTVLLYALASVLTWLIGRRTVGERAAVVGAVLLWISPAFYLWFSTRAYLYAFAVDATLAAVYLALRLRERDSTLELAALGLALGLSWWAVAQVTVLLASPVIVWLVVKRPSLVRRSWIAAATFVVGAAPWLAWNVRYHWLSLHARPAADVASLSFVDRLQGLFTTVFPSWLGLRVPFSLAWTFGYATSVVLLAVVAGVFVVGLVRRPRGTGPLWFVVVAFPVLSATSPFASYLGSPRYFVTIAPVLALLTGYLARSRAAAAVAAVVAVLLSVFVLERMADDGLATPHLGGKTIPRNLAPLVDLLERNRQRYVVADYWLAYRLDFESDEQIVATSSTFVRYAPYDVAVHAYPFPAYAYVAGSTTDRAARSRLEALGYVRRETGGLVAYVHR